MSRRNLIRMSDDEIRDFIRSRKTIILNSIAPGGYPHPMPMWFVLEDGGAIRMTTFRASQKVKNIQREPRVSLLAESGVEYGELMGVVFYGKAEIIDDIGEVTETLIAASGADVSDPEARKGMEAAMAKTASKRVVIRLQADRVVSWDHRKLGGTY